MALPIGGMTPGVPCRRGSTSPKSGDSVRWFSDFYISEEV